MTNYVEYVPLLPVESSDDLLLSSEVSFAKGVLLPSEIYLDPREAEVFSAAFERQLDIMGCREPSEEGKHLGSYPRRHLPLAVPGGLFCKIDQRHKP